MHFADNVHVIKDNLFQVPPLFQIIHDCTQTDWREMYQVFNMGHRMELYVDAQDAQAIINISESFGVNAQIIGRVEGMDSGKKLTIKSAHGEFVY
jgi:phosphoribosylformylglycinamidine cyclo-ligase